MPEAPPYQRGLAALASPHWGRWAAALREGVVAKCYDALGALDASRSRFRHRPSWRRLFFAHLKHGVRDDAPLVGAADVAQQRKLRDKQ